MPMNPNISAAILNELFKTGGSVGITAEEEAAQLSAQDIDLTNGYGPGMYFLAFKADGNQIGGETAKALDAKRNIVDATTWYQTYDIAAKEFTDYDPSTEFEPPVKLGGWGIIKRDKQYHRWPEKAYLALYTGMPGKDGSGYAEPAANTTYMRINLHEAIISGGVAIANAKNGEENYTSITINDELMAFPEVSGTAWGTIIGFGIHESAERGSGIPELWGRLSNPIATAVGKVPLFRKERLKFTFGPMGETEGCTILDGLLGFKTGGIYFIGNCWLGLLTRAPKADRTAYEDGKYFSEPDDPEYVRVRVDKESPINGKYIISGTEPGDPVAVGSSGDLGQPMVVKNQALIVMNEITQNTSVTAWGLWRSSDTTSDTKPFLWGTVKDSSGNTTITLTPEEIPIVREGGLRISMM